MRVVFLFVCVLLLEEGCTRFGFDQARKESTGDVGAREWDVLPDADGGGDVGSWDWALDRAGDAAGRADLPRPDGAVAETFVDAIVADAPARRPRALVGIQGKTGSAIAAFRVDPLGRSALEDGTYNLTSDPITTTGLRAFSRDGLTLLLGSFQDGNTLWRYSEQMSFIERFTLSGRSAGELPDVMGLCVLSDGHLIASSYSAQIVAEYDAAGGYVRDVYSTTFHMSDCVATGTGEVVIIDADANTDQTAWLRKLQRGGGAWGEVQSFELTTVGGGTNSSAWTLTYTGGQLYVPPLHPGGGGTAKMVRCPHADLTACAEFGDPFPRSYPDGAVEAVVALPGTADLLVADHAFLMRYSQSGIIVDLVALGVPDLDWVRKLQVVAP